MEGDKCLITKKQELEANRQQLGLEQVSKQGLEICLGYRSSGTMAGKEVYRVRSKK